MVWFCTDTHGDLLPDILRTALVRGRDFWRVPEYLGRIIFSEMVKGDERKLNGCGISTSPMKSAHRPDLLVDYSTAYVKLVGYEQCESFGTFVRASKAWWMRSVLIFS